MIGTLLVQYVTTITERTPSLNFIEHYKAIRRTVKFILKLISLTRIKNDESSWCHCLGTLKPHSSHANTINQLGRLQKMASQRDYRRHPPPLQ